MSAIFGILRFDGAPVSERDLERMGNALAPRGPDARRFVTQGPVGLGHCLLRVNHEDLFDRQPLRDAEADLTLVADCRLDNRDHLAAALQISPQQLRDMPDSALILHSYKKWGDNCAEHLLGDFAFAIWDEGAKRLVLGRDHMGQFALLYHRGEDFFAFASNQIGLLALPDVPQRVTTEQIAARLVGGALVGGDPGTTAIENVTGLPGGSVLVVGPGRTVNTRRYWEPRPDPAHVNRDEAYYVAAYRRVLGEAVGCRLRRLLHPPGLLLSGGYDSAAIAGLAGATLAGSGRKLIAVASVMPADYRGTIRHAGPWVQMCARDMPHLDIHYYARDDLDLLLDFDRACLETGAPISINGLVIGKMMNIAERAGARLIMNGHGGDYTLNPRGKGVLAHLLKTGRLRQFAAEFRAHRQATRKGWRAAILIDIVAPLLPPLANFWWRRRSANERFGRFAAINPVWAEELLEAGTIRTVQRRPGGDARARLAAVQRKIMDSPSHVSEIASLRGTQATSPFHDKRVVELALAIPPELYVRNGYNRHLARVALRDLYPPEFQTRGRNNDDQIPDIQWRVKSIEPRLLAEIARMERSEHLRRYIDFARVRELLAARSTENHDSGWEQEPLVVLRAVTIARYLERVTRRNS